MRRIILLRHGVTSWNLERRFQGQTDVELSESGVLQAKSVAAVLAAYEPSALWSSDLLRARATAEIVGEATGLTPRLDARLRETHLGELQGLTHAEAVERFGLGPYDYAEFGGERDTDVGLRFAAALTDLDATLPQGATALVVAHGAAIRNGLLTFLGWPITQVGALGPLANCGWVELTDEPTTWAQRAPWRMAAYNRVTPIS